MPALEEKLKKRKLDALRRGVHRVGGEASVASNIHFVAIGKAGASVLAATLQALPPAGKPVSVLAVDVGEDDVSDLRAIAATVPQDRASIEIVALDPVAPADLKATFAAYEDDLKLEYPFYPWSFDQEGWIPDGVQPFSSDGNSRRAYAKALYGQAYYEGDRPLAKALRRFGARIDGEQAQSIVCIVFALGGGTGSGIAVDLARHLTNVVLGRRTLVVGIGILPCDGDEPAHRGSALFAALNEFDCLGDEAKNRGVIASCGDLFRNPFTAGLLLVPQQHVWQATSDLGETHRRVDAEIASLLTGQDGANLMETLRMLNWVAAPSTQHSAARTPWGEKWIHMFAFADLADSGITLPDDFRKSLGILDGYRPEFMEVRLPSISEEGVSVVVSALDAALAPEVPPQTVSGGKASSVQFVLPSLRKTDLSCFGVSRALYEARGWEDRVMDHSLLLEQGIVLSEPSTRIEGMSGASLYDGGGWIAVPMSALLDHA